MLTRSHNTAESVKTYVKILKERIDEHIHFIESINSTSPGAIYVYDLQQQKELYSNQKMTELIGYTQEEIRAMGDTMLDTIVHPEHRPHVAQGHTAIMNAAPGEVLTIDCKVKHKRRALRMVAYAPFCFLKEIKMVLHYR